MSSNKPVLKVMSSSLQNVSPDYIGLVKFLIEPFLESPTALRIDCEKSNANERVWIRLAFEGADKGRVFGRGGRNIQAIRTVIQAVAQAAGQFAHLDIYEGPSQGTRRESPSGGRSGVKKGSSRRSSNSRPAPRSRSH
ncbi:MAG TPA: KH domain-containing protein [Coleofasciculaceae cyanobacterium]